MNPTRYDKILAGSILVKLADLVMKASAGGYSINLAEQVLIRCTTSDDFIADITIEQKDFTVEGLLAIVTDTAYKPYLEQAAKIEVIVRFYNADFKVEV